MHGMHTYIRRHRHKYSHSHAPILIEALVAPFMSPAAWGIMGMLCPLMVRRGTLVQTVALNVYSMILVLPPMWDAVPANVLSMMMFSCLGVHLLFRCGPNAKRQEVEAPPA